jgi:hypothetical protein
MAALTKSVAPTGPVGWAAPPACSSPGSPGLDQVGTSGTPAELLGFAGIAAAEIAARS